MFGDQYFGQQVYAWINTFTTPPVPPTPKGGIGRRRVAIDMTEAQIEQEDEEFITMALSLMTARR